MEANSQLVFNGIRNYEMFKANGCLLLENVISSKLIADAVEEINALECIGFDHSGDDFKHIKCIFNRSPFYLQFLNQPRLMPIIYNALGLDCHIIGMTGWRSDTGWGKKYLHTDNILLNNIPEELLKSGQVVVPPHIITAHFYLNDITIDCCPTYVIPKSHLSGRAPTAQMRTSIIDAGEEEVEYKYESQYGGIAEIPILAKAGDVLLFRSDIWHGGSKNTSLDSRYLIQTHYANRNVAQRFSPYTEFKYNKKVLAKCDEEQLILLGKHKQSYYD